MPQFFSVLRVIHHKHFPELYFLSFSAILVYCESQVSNCYFLYFLLYINGRLQYICRMSNSCAFDMVQITQALSFNKSTSEVTSRVS